MHDNVATLIAPAETGWTPRCTIREADFGDYEQMTALQVKDKLTTKSYDDWAHRWVNNPVYALVKDRWPIGWVLENASGQAVGFIGNIPLNYEFCGKRVTVAAGCSWVVEEEYRGYATWLMDSYFSHPAALYLNTTVAEQAVGAFSHFGSVRVPIGTWDARAFAITNFRGFVKSVLRLRKIPAAGFLSPFIAPFLSLSDRLRAQRIASALPSDLSPVDGFDQRFDGFWLELKKNFPDVLLGDRSAAILNWHFGPALARRHVWIITQTCGERLLAYAIFVRRDKSEIGLTRMRLADFQSLDGKNTLLVPMLEWARNRCRRERIHLLEVIGYDRENEGLMALLPHQRPVSAWQYYYLAKNQNLATLLRNPRAWRPYPYDGDAIL